MAGGRPYVAVTVSTGGGDWLLTVKQRVWSRGRCVDVVMPLNRPIGRHASLAEAMDVAIAELQAVRDRLPG